MITVHGHRCRGAEVFPDCPGPHNKSVEDAFKSLVKHELGFGGVVKEITPTQVVVETVLLSCRDTTFYSGSEEDMSPLVVIAVEYMRILAEERDEVLDQAYEKLERTGLQSSPLWVTNLYPILMGETTLHRAMKRMASRAA